MIQKITHGCNRLNNIASLPCIDTTSQVQYYGSIAKLGNNADWDWYMYKDSNYEWVLAEVDGPGCIFNFTQHRYPTSPVPVYRFYFDNSPTPQFELIPSDFGKKPPFIKPLADIFVGPEDGGNGPIWVVRSFVPMEFTSHCKITSSIRLEGCRKDHGEGGWGHVMLHRYESAEGLTTFGENTDISELIKKYSEDIRLAKSETYIKHGNFPKGKTEVFTYNGKNTLCGIKAEVENCSSEMLAGLVLEIKFDNEPTFTSPFGTFFGCEYGDTAAHINTSLLTFDNTRSTWVFENRFPMPFFEKSHITLHNKTNKNINISFCFGCNEALEYDPEKTGYFAASPYYPKTDNIAGKNSVICDINGHGHFVYGTLSGHGIWSGCEGDVRVFIDGIRTPVVESDGSESWVSYGWGFVAPPQVNPFSAYNGLPNANSDWSMVRLCIGDSYYFRSRFRFELEHGNQNDGGGAHSGQCFFYIKSAPIEEEIAIAEASEMETDGNILSAHNRFENGLHFNYEDNYVIKEQTFARFRVKIPADNHGIVLKRLCLQDKGNMEAAVFIDGTEIANRHWLYPDYNPVCSYLEDSFIIPEEYTVGKREITVEIRATRGDWNEGRYRVAVIKR